MTVAQKRDRAIVEALSLSRLPGLAPILRRKSLPADIEALLRIFARDAVELAAAVSATGESDESILASVDNYVLTILLFPGASSQRMLGVGADASRDETRRHFKLLMEGLHPDKTRDRWRTGHARRLIAAWSELSHPGKAVTLQPQAKSARVRLPLIAYPVAQRRSRFKSLALLAVLAMLLAATAVYWSEIIEQREGPILSGSGLAAQGGRTSAAAEMQKPKHETGR